MDNYTWELCQLKHEGVQKALQVVQVPPVKKKNWLKKNKVWQDWGQQLPAGRSSAIRRHFKSLKKSHRIRNLLNENEMYQWRSMNRNARCIMSTCKMQLQLTLLNSFVFLSSSALPSGKGLSPTTDYRRKIQGSKLLQGDAALFLYSQTPEIHADASGPTWACTGGKTSPWELRAALKLLLFQVKMWKQFCKRKWSHGNSQW